MRSSIDKRLKEGLEFVEGDSRFHGNDVEKRNNEIIEKTNSANFSLEKELNLICQ